ALARLGLAASDDDEIIQRVRVALLATDGAGISGYSGRGDLRSYVRAVAVRIALKRLEREEAASPDDDTDVLAFQPDAADSPELRLLKDRCRSDLRGAFATALASLEPRQRTLLRQHYVDGLTIDALGRLHRVHRSTCARWIETARADVLTAIRRHLRQALDLGESDLESALALVRSQLDLSLSRQLPR
nr:transcriptional regulator [Myxococcota bacterium]